MKQTAVAKKSGFGMVLPITLLAYFLILMDNSVIFTSSVQIGSELNLNAQALAWVSNSYTLTFGGFLLLAGRLSDLLGRQKIFQFGLALFGLSSLAIGMAPSAAIMIAFRAVQGIGASIIAPTTLALMMDAYQGEQRTKAIAYYGATAGIGSSVGLLLGGALTSFISWRAGFLVNVPITLALMALTQGYVRKDVGRAAKIDYVGSLLSVLGLASLIYGLDGDSWFILIGLFFMVAFFIYESVQEVPILPLGLLKNKVRFGAYVTRLLFMMAILPYWFLMPQQLQGVYGFSALQSGMAFLPLSITTFVTALQLPKLTKRFGNNSLLLFGELVLALGLLWAALSPLDRGYLLAVAPAMIVIGIGSALVSAPVTAAGIYQAPDELAGAASGLTNTMHQIGGPIGLSLIMSSSTSFGMSLGMMTLFTGIAFLVVFVCVFQFGKKNNYFFSKEGLENGS